MTPQLVRLYKTRSARDISYIFLVLNAVGLSFTFVYLFYNGATVTWIAILVEIGESWQLVQKACLTWE